MSLQCIQTCMHTFIYTYIGHACERGSGFLLLWSEWFPPQQKIHACMYTYRHVCKHTCVYIYMQACIHTDIHTHTHGHIVEHWSGFLLYDRSDFDSAIQRASIYLFMMACMHTYTHTYTHAHVGEQAHDFFSTWSGWFL